MYVFLVLFLPLMFLIFASAKSERFSFYSDTPYKVYLLGVVFAILYCFIEVLCIIALTYRQIRYSVFINWILLYVYDFLIPFAICFLLVFISSRKKITQRMQNLFGFLLGFYSIYLIYTTVLRYEKVSSFLLFCKPLLIFCQLFLVTQLLLVFLENYSSAEKQNRIFSAVAFVLMFLSSLIPSLIQTLSTLGLFKILRIILVLLYEILFILVLVYRVRLGFSPFKMKTTQEGVSCN